MKERAATRSCSSRSIDRSFYIENLGCAKNQVDAEQIIASLEQDGYTYTDDPAQAGIIVVNTCGFIRSAKEESIETTLSLKARFPETRIVLTGCLAERYKDSLSPLLSDTDSIIGNQTPSLFAQSLSLAAGLERIPAAPAPSNRTLTRKRLLSFPGSAYLKIAEGCGNRCTYCAIPVIRGPLVSRSTADVVLEARELIDRGIREINLVAQDLGSFGKDRGSAELLPLLEKLSDLQGDFWIRLLYLHPDNFPRGILSAIKADPRILPYFDIPFQHASERVLKRMNRSGNAEQYLDLIAGIRESIPEAILRSTFLVGFPGETASDFRQLLSFQEKAELNWAGFFSYSREEDTPAYSLESAIAHRLASPVVKKRVEILQEHQIPITEKRLEAFVGRRLRVLIEERVEGEDLYLCRAYLSAPEVDGLVVLHASDLAAGSLHTVLVVRRNGLDLEAVPVPEA